MFEVVRVLFFYTETPLHMGTGSAISYVDLPIEREKHTEYPVMPASGIKGVLRALAKEKWEKQDKLIEEIFGPEKEPEKHSSCISFTDGRILLLPVRSLKGVFAWVTCPFVLQRFEKDLQIAGKSLDCDLSKLSVPNKEAWVCSEESQIVHEGKILLEDYQFEARVEENADAIGEKLSDWFRVFPSPGVRELLKSLPERLAIISDDAFSEMCYVAMDISTRIKIDYRTGTVKEKALFTEEAVPSESVFYSLALFTPPFPRKEDKSAKEVEEKISKLLKECSLFQFGGDATVGRGLVRVGMIGGGEQ